MSSQYYHLCDYHRRSIPITVTVALKKHNRISRAHTTITITRRLERAKKTYWEKKNPAKASEDAMPLAEESQRAYAQRISGSGFRLLWMMDV